MVGINSPLRRAAVIDPYTDAEQSLRDNAFASPFSRSLQQAINTDVAGAYRQQALEAQVQGDAAAQRAAEYNRQSALRRMELPTVGPTTWDAASESGNYGDYVQNVLGSMTGSMVKPFAGSAVGGVVGGPFGAAVGGFGGSYSAIRNAELENYASDEQLSSLSPEEQLRVTRNSAALQAAPEAVMPAYLGAGGRLPGALSRTATPLRVAGGVAIEGATEGLQDYISQRVAQEQFPDRQIDWSSVRENAIAGLIGGGAMGVLGRHEGGTHRQEGEAAPIDLNPPSAPMEGAPPGTPPPPAPDDGSGGGVGGLFDTLNERFGPGLREQAQKTKDFVSNTIDRMGEAAKTAQTPSEFLRQVFGSSTEDAAAADLRPDTEDPGVMSAADPAAALQQRDAQRQERAAFFAEELLNDPATPDAVKERVASFGGDFTDPEARAFVARTLVAQRAGEKLVNAVSDLIDLSKDFGGKAAETGSDLAAKARGMLDKGMSAAADRIVKKNLQDATPAEQAAFNKLIFDSLTDEAKASPAVRQRLPELANAMLAFAARTGDLTKADLKTLSRMQDGLAMFRDPEQLAAKLTEYAGLPRTEDSFLSRVKRVTNAQQDILQPNSFLYSSLSEDAKDSLSQPQLRQLARLVDDFTLSDSSKAQGDKVLAGLTAALGSKESAQAVLDYYQQQNRADLRFDPTRPTKDAYEGTDDVAEYGTLPERDAPEQDTYYADAKSMRPFYEGREGRLSTEGGTRHRVRDVEVFMDRMQGRGVELRSQRYGDFLKERNKDSAEAVKRIRKDLEKRITEAAPRKGEAAKYAEGRKKNRQYLEEQLLALNLIDKADGPEAAANLFSVARAVGERNELGITDAQLAEADTLLRRTIDPKKPPRDMTRRQAEKHNRDIAKTKIAFYRTDGSQPLALSAESLWKAYAKGQPAGRSVRQLFADAVSAVLNRPDIAGLADGLDGVLIDRASGTYAEPRVSDEARAVKKELAHEYKARLSEAESQVEAVTSEIEDARDEGPADSELVERIEAAADELQREADAGRVVATALKDEAKAMPWEDGAPSPKAIKLRARAAWEHDISRVFAEGARDLRETATEVRSELDRVEDGSNDARFGNEFRRLERRRNDLQHAYDVAHDSGNEAAIKDAKRRLDAVEEAIKRMEAREAVERTYGSAGQTASEERGAAAKVRNYDESTGAALHPDDKPSAAEPKGLGKRLDAVLLANPELLEVLDVRGEPKDKGMTESRMRENLFDAYLAIKTPALKARVEGLRAKYQEAKNASNVGTPAAREAAKQEAAALKEIGRMVRWVLERREGGEKTPQEKVVKKSFVGAKADPQGASDAEKLLGIGVPADVVWRDLGWFRGPDDKLRKEIRSPVLRRRVREFATAIANGSRDTVMVRDLLAGVDAFKPYLDKLGDLPIDPNDAMVELMGAIGVYNGEDGFSSRGIGINRENAELAVRMDAVPGGKGIDLLHEIMDSNETGELEPRDFIAELEARHPMPDVNERVAEKLTGTILHELQHAFQHVEGFENGGNPNTAVIAKYGDVDKYLAARRDGDGYAVGRITEQAFAQLRAEVGPDGDTEAAAHKLYESIIGEVEANDVAARMNLSDEEAASVKPALMDAKREFVRSVLLAEALSTFRSKVNSSKVGGRPGRPGKNWGDKDAVKAEILRLRGKDVKVAVEKLVKQLGGSGQYSYDPATGERLIEVAINAPSPVGTARHEAMHDLFRFLSENDATRSVAKDLRDATSAPHVIRRLRELLKDHKAALEQLNDPEERAAYAYQFWAEGLLQIGPTGTGIFNTIRQFIKDMFGIVTAGQRGEDLLRAFHDGKFADPSTVQEVLQDINDSSGDRVANKLNRAAPALTRALNSLLSAAPERLRRFENDYLNELADKFQPEKGTGFAQNRPQQEGIWTNRLAGILRGTTAVERREAIDQLQAMKPTSKLAKELAKFNEDIYEYMRDAGVQSWDSATKKFVPLRKVQGYFTRSWDPDAIARNRSEFEALLRTEGGVSAADATALVENLVRGSEQRPKPKESPVDLGFMPYAPHTSERVLTFINSNNADKFAKFQRKDLADIMMSYVRGSTHRAEYAREFGNNGEKIVDLVAKSGIKDPKELGEISNAVQALQGSLDPGNWSVQTKEAMSAVLTLQNVTLLPLAIVSQMIDPIVLAARTGDIKDAGTAYVTALKRLKNTITKSKNKVPGEELAEILGVVSEDSTLQAMAMAYGTTRMSKRMENINRVFFKYNGMQGWNNSMRIAATAAGEKYLLAHKSDAKALAELGLEPKDIKSTGGKLDVSSPKVQQAMFQFVDQAVLRPSAANRPVWMSDPRFLLVAHLKQFTFAMHNVVLKRANRELQNDNPKPWGALMLAMPVILAADMAKFALTGTGPNTWGFKDYLVHAVERSGLLGLGDFGVQATRGVDMGKMPGEGLLGPTFENLMKILRWIGGDPRTDFGDVIDRTVPGTRFI